MLNWDDPLGVTENNDKTPDAVIAQPEALAEEAAAYVADTEAEPVAGSLQPGDGLQSNDVLMATAGAAPSVSPDPLAAQPAEPVVTQRPWRLPGWKVWKWVPSVSGLMTSKLSIAGRTSTNLCHLNMSGRGRNTLMAARITGCRRKST